MKKLLIVFIAALSLISCSAENLGAREFEPTITATKQIPKTIRVSYDKLPAELSFHKNKDSIALTLDAGASDSAFIKIMDILKKHNIRSTVFVTGQFAKKYPYHIKRLIKDGHEIGNHSYSHPNFRQISDQEIQDEVLKTENLLLSLEAKNPKPLFRYPFGARNHHTNEIIHELGYKSIFWSLDTIDWRDGAEEIESRLKKARAGDIILAHLGDVETAKVLEDVIKFYKRQNLKLLTISELLSQQGD